MCYDSFTNDGIKNMGEALYSNHFFICNTNILIDKEAQDLIENYNYCKTFNCPPYPSLKETPTKIYDSFLIISKEMSNIEKEQRKKKDG